MPELIERATVQTEIALIAKHLARSNAQKSLIGRILFIIDQMPTIEPEVRHGQWIDDGEIRGIDKYKCSLCGGEVGGLLDNTKYCCFCGAKMDLRTQTEASLDIADSVMMGGVDNDT